MICPNTADTIYRQHFDGGLYTVKGYPPVNGNAVAQDDDGNAYTTLQEAINVSKSDITLLADITESVEIGVYANVTIDFNGHTMTASDEYYAINSDGQLKLLDSSADQKGGTRSEILNKGMMQVYSGTYSVTTGNVFDNSGTATLWGGKYYGAPNQAVFLCYEGSGNPNMMSTGITFVDIEAYAGEGGTILGRQPGSTCFYIFAQQGSLGGGYFYGDLGMSEPEMVQLFGGHFDREPSADCVYTADNKAREIIKEGKFWRVTEKVNDPVATVTGEDGTNISFASLNDAVNRAAKLEAEKNDYYTVTLNKDVTTNVLTSFVTNKTVTIDLNGHILTAQDANKAAISAAGTKIFLRGSEGTINGRIESDTYLWIIHTTVNALEGQPAIANLSKNNDSLSIKGTSVINGAAGQAVIVSNGRTTIGDGATVVAGKDGILFEKGEDAANLCFFLDYCTLYGNLGNDDTLNTIYVNAHNGKCFTKFDREPSLAVVGFMTTKGSDGLYTYVAAPASAAVGNQEFTTLQMAIDYAAANGGTPKMVKSLTEDITVPAGTMTIDMNGCTLTGNVTANGTLNLKNGSVNGKVALGSGAALRFTNYNGLDNAALPDGYTLSVSADNNGYYNVVPYDKELHETVKNAVEKVDAYLAGIDSSYKLETLTDDQINALAGKAFGDNSNPINVQYNAICALDQEAMRHHLSTTRIGAPYNQPLFKLVNSLYSVANMEVKISSQQVESKVDTTKTELPKTEEKIPEDKQPTQQDAAAKVKTLKDELTGDNAAVKNFKGNNLTNTVKIKSLPNVQDNSKVELYVQAQLQDIKLGADVKKDADGNVTEVKLNSQTLVFDVTPMAKVDNHDAKEVTNDLLNGGSVVFRLPIPAEVTEKYAKVAHEGDADRYIEIKTEDGKKYIELSATHFSVFTVSFTNELPKPVEPEKPAASVQDNGSTNTASNSQSTTTTPKQDDSAYYTCKACGYHDWTAVDGGYKCNHCGYIESVKQLAGYPNVKGTATVGKAAANGKTTKAAMSAIPQTSDDMPVTALAIAAIAALLGLGVTVVLKRKNQ